MRSQDAGNLQSRFDVCRKSVGEVFLEVKLAVTGRGLFCTIYTHP